MKVDGDSAFIGIVIVSLALGSIFDAPAGWLAFGLGILFLAIAA